MLLFPNADATNAVFVELRFIKRRSFEWTASPNDVLIQ